MISLPLVACLERLEYSDLFVVILMLLWEGALLDLEDLGTCQIQDGKVAPSEVSCSSLPSLQILDSFNSKRRDVHLVISPFGLRAMRARGACLYSAVNQEM